MTDYIKEADDKLYFESYGSEEELTADNYIVPKEEDYISADEVYYELIFLWPSRGYGRIFARRRSVKAKIISPPRKATKIDQIQNLGRRHRISISTKILKQDRCMNMREKVSIKKMVEP